MIFHVKIINLYRYNLHITDYSESIPAFVCLIMMGMITYVFTNVVCRNFKKISLAMYILAALFILKFIFI